MKFSLKAVAGLGLFVLFIITVSGCSEGGMSTPNTPSPEQSGDGTEAEEKKEGNSFTAAGSLNDSNGVDSIFEEHNNVTLPPLPG